MKEPVAISEEARQKLRSEFLLAMYKAMWDNINRHITVLWQAVAVLGATFGVAFFAGRDTATWQQSPVFDLAAGLMIALSCWLVAHAIDASRWFNRNIQIIANIERSLSHLLRIAEYPHPYMTPSLRRGSPMPAHMRIQVALAALLALTAFVAHAIVRVAPVLRIDTECPFPFTRALPTLSLFASLILAKHLHSRAKMKHEQFEESLNELTAPGSATPEAPTQAAVRPEEV